MDTQSTGYLFATEGCQSMKSRLFPVTAAGFFHNPMGLSGHRARIMDFYRSPTAVALSI